MAWREWKMRFGTSRNPMRAIHEDYRREIHGRGPSDRSFGGVFTAAFLLFGLWPLRHGHPVRLWCLVLSGTLFLATLAWPALLHGPNLIWTRCGILLGRVVNPIVTGLLFYLVFTRGRTPLDGQGSSAPRKRPECADLLDSAQCRRGSVRHEKSVLKGKKMSFLAEFWRFLRIRKKFWLLPLLTVILIFGAFLVLAESSALAPFITPYSEIAAHVDSRNLRFLPRQRRRPHSGRRDTGRRPGGALYP